MKQIKFKLPNKLNVILVPSHKSPVVSVQMWVRTGSADEVKGEEGISHFIEHLVFKGTKQFKVGEIASTVEASGGELNAYTSFDQTVFYVTISKNFSNVALNVVSEMMGFPLFDKGEVDSEREVVCEEIKMGIDSPQRSASQLLFSSVFKKHAYGKPVIGYDKNVRSWPVSKIKKFFNSRYVPTNMTLIVTGDFDPKEMKKQVTEKYGSFQDFKLKKIVRKKEPVQKKSTFSSRQKNITESTFQIAWPAPGVKHKDAPALDMLAMILGQGETSRLVNKLRLEKPLVNSVSAFSYTPIDAGLFAVVFKLVDQDRNEVFKTIFQEIEDLSQNGAKWSEIKKSVITISSDQFYSLETVDGIADKVGTDEFYFKDPKAHEKYLKKIQKLTPADIQKVAKKYLVMSKANYSVMNKESEKIQIASLKEGEKIWKQVQAENKNQKVKAKNPKVAIPKIQFSHMKESVQSDIEIYKTKMGNEIIFKSLTEIPTVSAKIIFGGGARLENEKQQGLTEMLTRIWPSETQTKSEMEVLNILDDCAAGINSFGGKNTVGLSVDYMKTFEDRIIDLTQELLVTPKFNAEIFEREKSVLLKQIQSKQDHPSYLCHREFLRQMYPNSPLSYEQSGTAETLANVTLQNVQDSFKQLKSNTNMQVSVVGDFDKKKWIAAVEAIERTFSKEGKRLKTIQVDELKENKSSFLNKDKEQSHVMIGWKALDLKDNRRYALQIIDAVLSGQGGRLFFELRDKNSLAYSVAPIKMETLETGYFGGYIACSPDKVEKSIQMFHEEFAKLTKQLITDEELERAKRYLIGQNDIGLQRKSSYCNLISFDRFYGNDINEHFRMAEIYSKISKEDIRNVAKDLFTKNYVVSVVGKKAS